MKGFRIFTTLLLVVVTLISMFGCSKDSDDLEHDNSRAYASVADTSLDKKDGLPPVNDELKALYEKAFKFECDINFDNIGLASNKDGSLVSKRSGQNTWYKVEDERFATYTEFEAYFSSIFTEKLADEKIELYKDCFKDINGHLYTLCGARGSNITYAGHYFTIDSVNESSVLLTAHVYFADDVVTSNPIYEKQADESKYTVENVKIEFVKENDFWKLNQFKLFY